MGILARLILKFGIPFLRGLFDEIFFVVFFGFFVCFLLLFSKDFKVFVAFSSILHITVFCLRLYIFNFSYLNIFWSLIHFYLDVYFFTFLFCIKIFWFVFTPFLSRAFLVFWLRVPFIINFLVEFFMFNYLFFDLMSLIF